MTSIKLKYKKFNFDKHWSEFRRQPKWRTLSTNICSTKRIKLNNCWTYPSSMNETPIYDNVVESSICLKDAKATKKEKGKSKTIQGYEELKASMCRRLDLIA